MRLYIYNPALQCYCDRVSSVIRIELHKNSADVTFHCVITDMKPVSDDLVRATCSYLFQDLNFTFCQLGASRMERDLRFDGRKNAILPGVYGPDRCQKFFAKRRFQEVSHGPRLKGTNGLNVTLVRREHNDPRGGMRFSQYLDHVNSTHIRQTEIQKHDVRLDGLKEPYGFRTSGGLADKGHVRLAANHGCEALKEHRVIVDDDDSNSLVHVCSEHPVLFFR